VTLETILGLAVLSSVLLKQFKDLDHSLSGLFILSGKRVMEN